MEARHNFQVKMANAAMRRNILAALVTIAAIVAFGAPACFLPQLGNGRHLSQWSSPGSQLRGVQPSSAVRERSLVEALACVAAAAAAMAAASRAARSTRMTRRCKGEEEWLGAEKISALTESVGPGVLDNIEIAKILPHRYPFLLVDKVLSVEKFKRAVGVKNITANEPQFTGHFPDRPIMPGVLMVEALAQLAGCVCMNPGDQVFFAGIDGVKFRKPVVPGDTLVMEVEVLKFREKSGIAKLSGKAYVDGKLAIQVKEFTCALVK